MTHDANPPHVALDVVRRRADLLAHDFNDLLTTILGYANLLSRSLEDGDPRRADADEIIAGAQRASALVRQLRLFGRDPDHPEVAAPAPPDDRRPAESRSDSPAASWTARSLGTILVVDDERTVRYLVRTILARAGYDVIEADTADAADQWVAAHARSLDLLISDIALPDSSGPDLATRLRARQPALKVLFISGYSDDQVRRDPRIEPDMPFVQKPFTAETLTEQVQRLLAV